MIRRFLLLTLLTAAPGLLAQSGVTWTEISGDVNLPASVQVFEGLRSAPLMRAWYMDIDLSDPDVAVRPYLGYPQGVETFTRTVGAYAAVNGGFFSTTGSVSAVIYPEELLAQNITALNRDGLTYPVVRPVFGLDRQRRADVRYVYHFAASLADMLTFADPAANTIGNPAPVPLRDDGAEWDSLWVGLGGGPNLVDDGQARVTWLEEVFFGGSGIERDLPQPRTAVGVTADNRVILMVVDGRDSNWSLGATLPELAEMLLEVGCVEGMNLDGGGSSQMATGDTLFNRPEGGTFQRPVPTILAVVHSDSIPVPPTIYFEDIIDTGDPNAEQVGFGWFASANPGYYGDTPALLNTRGDGSNQVIFRPEIQNTAEYEVYAWWVADPNRSADTPVVVRHAGGEDTVRVNQRQNSAMWNYVGTWTFAGSPDEAVILSNAADTPTFVVADAVRLISYDSSAVVGIVPAEAVPVARDAELYGNWPNPFNPETRVEFGLRTANRVRLTVHDVLGRVVATLVDSRMPAGRHTVRWDGREASGRPAASGVYLLRLTAGGATDVRKMALVR